MFDVKRTQNYSNSWDRNFSSLTSFYLLFLTYGDRNINDKNGYADGPVYVLRYDAGKSVKLWCANEIIWIMLFISLYGTP